MIPEKTLDKPARVLFSEGHGQLPRLEIETAWSNAEIYLHGAHLTHFQRTGEPPLLFLSQKSRFAEGAAIRGGMPIIFPWFGARAGEPSHGFARTQTWTLREICPQAGGAVEVRFSLPGCTQFSVEYRIIVGETLTAELAVTNLSSRDDFTFENCLHTYFAVGDINAVSVTGLKGVTYLDKTENFAPKIEVEEQIKIIQETDRTYLDTTGAVEIHDAQLARRIRVEKSGSRSTVVWNPWETKARELPDFGDDEYRRMICVESGNVGDNRVTLPPEKRALLRVELSIFAL